MTLFESQESNGLVSLADLFNGTIDVCNFAAQSNLTVPQIAAAICRGGWPEAVVRHTNSPRVARNYIDALVNADIQNVDGVERNPQRVRQLLRSYARNISTMATNTTLLDDIRANDTAFSMPTLSNYLNALERLYIIEDIPAWKPSLRSKSAIRTSEKRQFVDPSIAVAALHADAESILNDFEYFGFLFEALVARDLRVYAQTIDGELFHYRDKDKLEADLIIRLHDGRWAAVEVKLGNREIDEGAKHLLQLAQKVDTDKVGKPSFLMVVTGAEFAYVRPDGVFVVPIGCLKH